MSIYVYCIVVLYTVALLISKTNGIPENTVFRNRVEKTHFLCCNYYGGKVIYTLYSILNLSLFKEAVSRYFVFFIASDKQF